MRNNEKAAPIRWIRIAVLNGAGGGQTAGLMAVTRDSPKWRQTTLKL
jgi:hypothetical protein